VTQFVFYAPLSTVCWGFFFQGFPFPIGLSRGFLEQTQRRFPTANILVGGLQVGYVDGRRFCGVGCSTCYGLRFDGYFRHALPPPKTPVTTFDHLCGIRSTSQHPSTWSLGDHSSLLAFSVFFFCSQPCFAFPENSFYFQPLLFSFFVSVRDGETGPFQNRPSVTVVFPGRKPKLDPISLLVFINPLPHG